MLRVVLFTALLILPRLLTAQSDLRQFEVREVTPPDKDHIVQGNSQFPDDALIFIYSTLTGLSFQSSLIVHQARYDKQAGYYMLLVPPARQIIRVMAPGFMGKSFQEQAIDLAPKDVRAYSVSEQIATSYLPSWGELTIQVKPNDAELSINGKPVRLTDGQISFRGERGGLPAANYRMVVTKEKYRTEFRQLELKGGDQKLLTIELQPHKGKLRVITTPAGADVFFNGESFGKTPLDKEVLIGRYEVSVKLKDHLDEVRDVNVREDDITEVKASLFNYRRELQPLMMGRKVSLGFASVSTAAGVWAMASTISNLRKYQSATTGAADIRQKVVTGSVVWPVCMLAGASGFAGWYFLGRKLDKKKREFRLSAAPLPGGGIIQITQTIGRGKQ